MPLEDLPVRLRDCLRLVLLALLSMNGQSVTCHRKTFGIGDLP